MHNFQFYYIYRNIYTIPCMCQISSFTLALFKELKTVRVSKCFKEKGLLLDICKCFLVTREEMRINISQLTKVDGKYKNVQVDW